MIILCFTLSSIILISNCGVLHDNPKIDTPKDDEIFVVDL